MRGRLHESPKLILTGFSTYDTLHVMTNTVFDESPFDGDHFASHSISEKDSC